MGEIGIITVLYSSSAVLPDFFRSLDRQTLRGFTLYVVDNASPDDSFELSGHLAGSVGFTTVFLKNTTNVGIARGNNTGIAAARRDGCEWILLSNNDTVWEPDTLKILREEVYRCGAEIAVPRILQQNTGNTWYAEIGRASCRERV